MRQQQKHGESVQGPPQTPDRTCAWTMEARHERYEGSTVLSDTSWRDEAWAGPLGLGRSRPQEESALPLSGRASGTQVRGVSIRGGIDRLAFRSFRLVRGRPKARIRLSLRLRCMRMRRLSGRVRVRVGLRGRVRVRVRGRGRVRVRVRVRVGSGFGFGFGFGFGVGVGVGLDLGLGLGIGSGSGSGA